MSRRHMPADEQRLCDCGALVQIWRGKGHFSLSHRAPLCPHYAQSDDDIDGYLLEHTTIIAAPAVETEPTAS